MGVVDRRRHPLEVAIEQIDMDTADQEPAATVDPGPPAAERRDLGRGAAIIECRRDAAEGGNVDRPAASIIDADVLVGRGRRRAAGTRAAQRNRRDTGHRRQRPDQAVEQGFVVCIGHGLV
jgi:hypothetical protein